MKAAQLELGIKSKTEVIIYSLKVLLRRKRIEVLKELVGKVHIEIDLEKSRRRPNQKKGLL